MCGWRRSGGSIRKPPRRPRRARISNPWSLCGTSGTAEARGEIVRLAELSEPIFDAEFPFIAANPDRIYTNRKRILECKTADEAQLYEAGTEWGHGRPA